jgi:exosortase
MVTRAFRSSLLPRQNWSTHHVLQLIALLALGIWLNREPLKDIVAIGWNDPEQSHIFLAPMVAIYLLWLRRSRLRSISVRPSFWGIGIAALGWIMSWWGFENGTQIAWHVGAALSLLGIVLSMTGLLPLMLLAPVFGVLAFIVPIPGELRHAIAYPLQEIATSVTHSMLEFIGVSAIRSGNVLIINGEQVAVGEACNGMRMVFALTLVVYGFAFGMPLKPGTRITLLLLSPGIAMVCNVLRLVPTSLIFGYSDVHVAQRFHDLAGWMMLPVAMILLAVVLRTIRWLEFPVTQLRLATR